MLLLISTVYYSKKRTALDFIETLGIPSEEFSAISSGEVARSRIVNGVQLIVRDKLLVDREIGAEHAAIDAKECDHRVDERAQALERRLVLDHGEAADLTIHIGRACHRRHSCPPRRHGCGVAGRKANAGVVEDKGQVWVTRRHGGKSGKLGVIQVDLKVQTCCLNCAQAAVERRLEVVVLARQCSAAHVSVVPVEHVTDTADVLVCREVLRNLSGHIVRVNGE